MIEPDRPDPNAQFRADIVFCWTIVFAIEGAYHACIGFDSVLVPTGTLLGMCLTLGLLVVSDRLS